MEGSHGAGPAGDGRERDYYAVLGVPETATRDEVIRAYRRLARKSHPDADIGNPHATDDFESLAAAREVLGDPAARAAYDESRASHSSERPQVRREPTRGQRNQGSPLIRAGQTVRLKPPIRPGPVVWRQDDVLRSRP